MKKRSFRGIFFNQLQYLKQHLHLDFNLDYASDFWKGKVNPHYNFLNEKAAKSKLILALHDIG